MFVLQMWKHLRPEQRDWKSQNDHSFTKGFETLGAKLSQNILGMFSLAPSITSTYCSVGRANPSFAIRNWVATPERGDQPQHETLGLLEVNASG